MKIILSSSRSILAEKLFLEVEEKKTGFPGYRQVILVPDEALAAWLLLVASRMNVCLLHVDLKVVGGPYDDLCLYYCFGFREIELCHTQRLLVPTSWYLFSPCGHFWSDLLSERELGRKVARTKLHARNSVQEALENFYAETNSLLSNAATLGRESARAIDELSGDTEAVYPVPVALLEDRVYRERMYDEKLFLPNNEEVTLLRRVQADLIFLVGARTERLEIVSDDSLQIIGAPTIGAEVAALAETIQELGQRGPIGLGDIMVLTPTPSLYEPVLRYFLPTLKVQTLYEEKPALFQKMQGLFDLFTSRFNKRDLISLASRPEMAAVLGCDDEEMLELRVALTASSLTWGIDSSFRKKWLDDTCIQPKEEALCDDTIHSLFANKLNSLFEVSDIQEPIDSAWKNILRYLALVERLGAIWEVPVHANKKKPVAVWLNKVERSIEELISAFSADELQTLSSICLNVKAEPISATDFFALYLEQVLLMNQKAPQAILGHVLVGSLLHTIPHPTRCIAFLGMGEEEMRRFISEQAESLGQERARVQDRMNYAVIDGIMQAHERVLFSFLAWDFELREKKDPSLIVSLIENYVESQFAIEKIRREKNILFTKKQKSPRKVSSDVISIPFPKSMNIEKFLYALSDPLSYYMKQAYGQKKELQGNQGMSLFSPTKHIERFVENELTSRLSKYRRGQKRGVSSQLLQRELQEVKSICEGHLETYFGVIRPQQVRHTLRKQLFSCLQLEGELTLYPPLTTIIVAEDMEKAILDGLWAKLTLLSGYKNEIGSLGIDPSIFCAVQGIKKELPDVDLSYVEYFFKEMHRQPIPFHFELLPMIMGPKASFSDFEETVEEMVRDGDPLVTSLALSTSKACRENAYPMWKEYVDRLILPWIEWGGTV